MEQNSALVPTGEVLAQIEAALNLLDPRRVDTPPEVRLRWLSTARRLRNRLDALTGLLTAEAESSKAAEQTAGTPLASWLGTTEVVSRKEAARAVFQGRALGEHRGVGKAASEGEISAGQAQAIGRVLHSLAPQLDATQQDDAETVMLQLAGQLDAEQLAKAAPRVLSAVSPADADNLIETRLQRQAEAAVRNRCLRFSHYEGSVHFEGSLPQAEGEHFIAAINTHREKLRRAAIERSGPTAETTPEQRRADALISLLDAARKAKPEPGLGAARILVTLSYDKLHTAASEAGLIGKQVAISAGELRQLCCDADLIPAVLGTHSEPLDLGRTHRLVTTPIRDALCLRDHGCAFPNCGVRPELCEAHHITPWWNGGDTSLSNLVLLCHHHHGLIEPAKHSSRDQWLVHIAETGLPVFTPPVRHQRLAARLLNQKSPPCRKSPEQLVNQGLDTDEPRTGLLDTG